MDMTQTEVSSPREWILLIEKIPPVVAETKQEPPKSRYVQSGPYSTDEVVDLLHKGEAKYSDYIWKTGFDQWVRINEIDDFFQFSRVRAGLLPVSVKEFTEAEDAPESATLDSIAESNASHLEQVFEQTKLQNVDFIDEPVESSAPMPQDLLEHKQLSLDSSMSFQEGPRDFSLKENSKKEAAFDFSFELEKEPTPNLLTHNRVDPSGEVTRLQEGSWTMPAWVAQSSRWFPWVMTGLCLAISSLFLLWYNRSPEVTTTAREVKSIHNIENKPEVKKQTHHREERKPTPKVVSKKDSIEPVILARSLKKKAKLLEKRYVRLKGKPTAWRRFYRQWKKEFESTKRQLSELDKDSQWKQLREGSGLIEARGQVMNRFVLTKKARHEKLRQRDIDKIFDLN